MKKMKGSCLCGGVHYESTVEPVMTAACHCTHCRKQSGTAFSVVIAVPAETVTITGNTLKSYTDMGSSGFPMERKFCGNCGSPILSEPLDTSGLYFIKAGTLDDSSWIKPSAEIWCDSKVSWAALPEALPKIPQNPPAG